MWMKEITGRVYSDRKELGNDVVKLLINEIRRLVEMGAGIIQIDEPILSEVVLQGKKGIIRFTEVPCQRRSRLIENLNL